MFSAPVFMERKKIFGNVLFPCFRNSRNINWSLKSCTWVFQNCIKHQGYLSKEYLLYLRYMRKGGIFMSILFLCPHPFLKVVRKRPKFSVSFKQTDMLGIPKALGQCACSFLWLVFLLFIFNWQIWILMFSDLHKCFMPEKESASSF